VKHLLERVTSSFRERNLIERAERLLVGVSGGLDSMVLLHLLHKMATLAGWKLSVAHFNHQLRGRASDADEQLVRRTATAFGLQCEVERGDVKGLAKLRGISVEMAARELRHQFLAHTARRLKCSTIATAHHADDQVELFFLRLLRGAGSEGLGGMKWSSPSPVSKSVRLIRPLLAVSKADLENYARENKIHFREDASNASRDILRNRVRHELLPLLRKRFQPALNQTVLRAMELVGAEAEAGNMAARAWLAKAPRQKAFVRLPVAEQRQVIQLQLLRLKVLADFDLIEALRLRPGCAVSINPQRAVAADRLGQVRWAIPPSRAFKKAERKLDLVREKPPISFAGLELDWNFITGAASGERGKPAGQECFDAAKVGRNIVLRYWRPGDRFQPIGMNSSGKLQDWFINQKIPAARRRELVIATTAGGEIFWVEGLRIGERFKLDTETREQLRWRWWC